MMFGQPEKYRHGAPREPYTITMERGIINCILALDLRLLREYLKGVNQHLTVLKECRIYGEEYETLEIIEQTENAIKQVKIVIKNTRNRRITLEDVIFVMIKIYQMER